MDLAGFRIPIYTTSTVTMSLEPLGLGVVEAIHVKSINANYQLYVKLKHKFPLKVPKLFLMEPPFSPPTEDRRH